MLVDLTLLLVDARVELFVLHGALEEALATLARQQAVVEAADFVAAHGTQVVEAELDVQRHVRRVHVEHAYAVYVGVLIGKMVVELKLKKKMLSKSWSIKYGKMKAEKIKLVYLD